MWQSKGHIVFLEVPKNVWELEEHMARLSPLGTSRGRVSEKGIDSDLEHTEWS